jgi:hypothetical protein
MRTGSEASTNSISENRSRFDTFLRVFWDSFWESLAI